MNLKKNIIILFLIVWLSACVGSASSGIFGTGVSVALDPRTIGTQIDDSIMQKNLQARLTFVEKKYFIKISVKVLDGRIFLGGKVDEPEEKLNITKMAWETKGARPVKNNIAIKQKFSFKNVAKDVLITSQLKTALILNKNVKSTNFNIDYLFCFLDNFFLFIFIMRNAKYINFLVNSIDIKISWFYAFVEH